MEIDALMFALISASILAVIAIIKQVPSYTSGELERRSVQTHEQVVDLQKDETIMSLLNHLQGESLKKDEELNQLRKNMLLITGEVTELRNLISTERSKHEETRRQLQSRIDTLQKENNLLRSKIEDLEKTIPTNSTGDTPHD